MTPRIPYVLQLILILLNVKESNSYPQPTLDGRLVDTTVPGSGRIRKLKRGGKRSKTESSSSGKRKGGKKGKRGNIFEKDSSSKGRKGNAGSKSGKRGATVPSAAPVSTAMPTIRPLVTADPTSNREDGTSVPTIAPSLNPTLREGSTSSPTSSRFSITLQNLGTTTDFDATISRAARRWEEVIQDDLPDRVNLANPYDDFFPSSTPVPSSADFVDDLLIGYDFGTIDGASGTLGRAGPTVLVFESGGLRTIAGGMFFDIVDFTASPDDDNYLVILHEMGHILGIGGSWLNRCGVECRSNDVFDYTCPRANQEYLNLNVPGGTNSLLIESGDIGKCGHWEDESFPAANWSDVMTAVFEGGKAQLLTRVDVGAIEDLGGFGTMNFSGADTPPSGNSLEIQGDNIFTKDIVVPSRTFRLGENANGDTTITYED